MRGGSLIVVQIYLFALVAPILCDCGNEDQSSCFYRQKAKGCGQKSSHGIRHDKALKHIERGYVLPRLQWS